MIKNIYRNNGLAPLFGLKDEKQRGRLCLLFSNIFASLVNYLVTGTLYTAFLTANEFSLKDVTLIGILPALASTIGILIAPIFWERIKRRKLILFFGKLIYYIIIVLITTLLPYVFTSNSERIVAFTVSAFFSNLFIAIVNNGYAPWHLNFLPDEVCARYFSVINICMNIIGGALLITTGLIADAIRGTDSEMTVLITLRLVGFIFAVIDMVSLLIPKEYPYPHGKDKIKFLNIFILPFKHKPFWRIMMYLSLWTFTTSLSSSGLNYFLMNTVGIKLVVLNLVPFVFGIVFIFLAPFWQKVQKKYFWFATFSFGVFFYAPYFLLMAFLTPENKYWLYPIAVILYFIGNTPIAFCSNNLTYINMPKEDRSYYFAFSTLRINFLGFISQIISSAVVSALENNPIVIFGFTLTAIPVLLIVQFILFSVFGVLFYINRDSMTMKPGEQP